MSANAIAYWEKELNEASGRLKELEQDQDHINPFLHEQWRQERQREIEECAAQLQLAHQKGAE